MGLADREYARKPPPGGPLRGTPMDMRYWSFNTWLIIINVVVFLFGMASQRLMVLQDMGKGGLANVSVSLPTRAPDRVNQQSLVQPGLTGVSHWVDESTGLPVLEYIDHEPVPGSFLPSQTLAGGFADQWWALDYKGTSGGVEVTPQLILERRYMPMLWPQKWGHFSTARAFFGLEVWRFITFQFLHADTSHLVFNMIGLFFFGPLVEGYLRTRKRYAAYYLVCGIFGALLYLLLNLIGWVAQSQFNASVPGLLINDVHMPLIGASAGVFGVLMASAFIAGKQTMYVFMIIPMKIRTGAYLLTAVAFFNLLMNGQNAGGDAAHLGGAIAGFFFIRNMHLLNDFFDVLGPGKTRKPRRTVSKRTTKRSTADEERLDAILKKVSEEGLHSLTEKEQKFLREQKDRSERSG